MLQVKTFSAASDEELNAVLKQVPDGAFVDLRIVGEYVRFRKNTYMLLMQSAQELKITAESDKYGLACSNNSSMYYNDATGKYGV